MRLLGLMDVTQLMVDCAVSGTIVVLILMRDLLLKQFGFLETVTAFNIIINSI